MAQRGKKREARRPIPVTATMLYDFVQCPSRPMMDILEDPSKRDKVSKFVQLLWERGTEHEEEVIQALDQPYTNLRYLPAEERERETKSAMTRGDKLIYGARFQHGDLLGEPDLLRWQEGKYVAGDIKSGAAYEAGSDLEDGKPKKHYAVQLALYTDILEGLNASAGKEPFVWDVHGREISYNLDAPQGPRTRDSLWQMYNSVLSQMRGLIGRSETPRPALGAGCKLCHWRSACIEKVKGLGDLTLIPELGRAKRDAMLGSISTVTELASTDLSVMVRGKKTVFPGIGVSTLEKMRKRAQLQASGGQPYLTAALELPTLETELFFDVETDPMRDVCYLHGFVERRGGDCGTEDYLAFFADGPAPRDEERAFSQAVSFIRERMPCAIYFYSKYERTIWRSLSKKYPSVAPADEIDSLFGSPGAVDLYNDVVQRNMIWPTRDHSVKTLASYLGFKWRDKSPSGADSIEWYHRWVETGDAAVKQRILEYNEDDCRAMRVLVDALRTMAQSP